jgi:ABC-2 type transport system ATP-binding protein
MSRVALWDEVRRLNEDGTTVLLTTQYLEEADQLAGRIAIIDHGRIVKEGEPKALKDEVGAPTLIVALDTVHELVGAQVLAHFGEPRAAPSGSLGVGLAGGAEALAAVVRALDEAGVAVQHMELNAPSLDDVFAEATGHRLEGAGEAPSASDGAEPDEPPRRRGRRR